MKKKYVSCLITTREITSTNFFIWLQFILDSKIVCICNRLHFIWLLKNQQKSFICDPENWYYPFHLSPWTPELRYPGFQTPDSRFRDLIQTRVAGASNWMHIHKFQVFRVNCRVHILNILIYFFELIFCCELLSTFNLIYWFIDLLFFSKNKCIIVFAFSFDLINRRINTRVFRSLNITKHRIFDVFEVDFGVCPNCELYSASKQPVAGIVCRLQPHSLTFKAS